MEDEIEEFLKDARGYSLFNEVTDRNGQNWESMDEVSRESWRRRASGNLDFIPSSGSHVNAQVTVVEVREIPLPEVPPRPATLDEMPRAAKAMLKKLETNDWRAKVEYGKHSWPKPTEKIENEAGEVVEKIPFGIVESIVVKGRRGKQGMFAVWMTKPWTKDGDSYKFLFAHFYPGVGKVGSDDLKTLIALPEGGEDNGSIEGEAASDGDRVGVAADHVAGSGQPVLSVAESG